MALKMNGYMWHDARWHGEVTSRHLRGNDEAPAELRFWKGEFKIGKENMQQRVTVYAPACDTIHQDEEAHKQSTAAEI